MKCVSCGAPVDAKGLCTYCGTVAQGVRSCGDCPMNQNNYRVTQTQTEQRWYDKDGNVVRRFRVWDDGFEQGKEEIPV